jgi:hypothetical protein
MPRALLLHLAFLERLELSPANFHLHPWSPEHEFADWLGKILAAADTPTLKAIVVRVHLTTIEDVTRIDWRRLDASCTLGTFPVLERVIVRIVMPSRALRSEILHKRLSASLHQIPVMPEVLDLCHYAQETILMKMPYLHREGLLRFEYLDTNGSSSSFQVISGSVPSVYVPRLNRHPRHVLCLTSEALSPQTFTMKTPLCTRVGTPILIGVAHLREPYPISVHPCVITLKHGLSVKVPFAGQQIGTQSSEQARWYLC